MGQPKKIIKDGLLFLGLLTLSTSGCREDKARERLPIQKAPAQLDPKTGQKTSGKGASTASVGDCQSLRKKALELGFKVKDVKVSLVSGTLGSSDLSVFYLEKTGPNLKNPVLFVKTNGFQEMTQHDLENLKKISDSTKIDPIALDQRGSSCQQPPAQSSDSPASLQDRGSRAHVLAAERVRGDLLKGRPWKILSFRSGGAVALRYVEMKPEALQSIHIADFTPISNVSSYLEFRKKQERQNWDELLKATRLERSTVAKAIQEMDKLDLKKSCGEGLKCRDLIQNLAPQLSYRNAWSSIADEIQKWAQGKIEVNQLVEEYVRVQRKSFPIRLAQRIDLALMEASKECEVSSEDYPLSTCQLEKNLQTQDCDKALQSVRLEALNIEKIRQNLEKAKITYSLVAGGRSTYAPLSAFEEHQKDFEKSLETGFLVIEEKGSEVLTDPAFLKSLQARP